MYTTALLRSFGQALAGFIYLVVLMRLHSIVFVVCKYELYILYITCLYKVVYHPILVAIFVNICV